MTAHLPEVLLKLVLSLISLPLVQPVGQEREEV